jgi:hypothetical protein
MMPIRMIRSFVLVLAFLGAYALSGCDSAPAGKTAAPPVTTEGAPSSDGKTAEPAVAEAAPSPVKDSAPESDPQSQKSGGEFPAGITNVALLDKEVLSRRKPIVVTFTDPMVPDETLDKPVAARDMPFSIHPPVSGEGRWLTKQSFVFAADKDYWPGKKYSLLFHEDLRSLNGRPTRMYYSFTTAAPQVNRVQAGAFDAANLQQKIYLDFSLPVRPEALAEHLEATDSRSGETLGLDMGGADRESSRHSVLVDLGVHRPEITLTLRADRDDDSSPLGLSAPRSFTFRLPDPGDQTSVTRAGGAGEDSPLSLREPDSYENEQGEIFVRFPLSEDLAESGDWQE